MKHTDLLIIEFIIFTQETGREIHIIIFILGPIPTIMELIVPV
jgi:hypothetical protein